MSERNRASMNHLVRKSISLCLLMSCLSLCLNMSPASAYPPGKTLKFSLKKIVIKPGSPVPTITLTNLCVRGASVYLNGVFYKSIPSVRGKGTLKIRALKVGKYNVKVNTCGEVGTTTIYVPGAVPIPQKQLIKRPLTLYVKYLPAGYVVTFKLGGKIITKVKPVRAGITGISKIVVPKSTFKKNYNQVTLLLGTLIKISGKIKGI